jgi:flagellar biosynthesis anti-sigma factor FlgM
MRIDSNAIIQKIAGVQRKGINEVDAAGASGVDSMELSSRAADFRTALEALTAAPAVREARVAELRSQLEQGSLLTDGNSLAEKLLKKA